MVKGMAFDPATRTWAQPTAITQSGVHGTLADACISDLLHHRVQRWNGPRSRRHGVPRDAATTAATRTLVAAALVALCLVGCTTAPTVNERFVPTTVGVVVSREQLVVAGEEHARYKLADGQSIELVIADLDPFKYFVEPGNLLLMGRNNSDWVLGAGPIAGDRTCYTLGGRAFNQASTLDIEIDPSRGWFLVVPKAPGYADHGSDANGVLSRLNCLDDQGRALGPDGS